jgi:murein DD-endopeptidase MepM/ murein hydrolase activator NlpD
MLCVAVCCAASSPAFAETGDDAFQQQFRTWQSLDRAGPPAIASAVPAAAAPARITIGTGPALATVTVGVGAPSEYGSVTFGRAIDAAGAPIDFARMRRASPLSLSSISRPSGMPVSAAWMSSGFGLRGHPILGGLRLHSGIDLAAPMGSPVFATSDGVVRQAEWRGGYGLLVALDHGGGLQTRYGHMSRLAVAAGQQVRKGDVIGYVGSTGRSTGPHVHYEMRINGQAVNPASSIRR